MTDDNIDDINKELDELCESSEGRHRLLLIYDTPKQETSILLDDSGGSYAVGRLKDIKQLFDVAFLGRPGRRYVDPALLVFASMFPKIRRPLKTARYMAELRGCDTVEDGLDIIIGVAMDKRVREWEKEKPTNIVKKGGERVEAL